MSSEYLMLTLGAVAAGVYVFRDSLFGTAPKSSPAVNNVKTVLPGGGDPRDFVARMKASVCPIPHSRLSINS
jgi:NADPH-ferrihemoprotein reductase